MNKTLKDKIYDICESLYKTGVNDGKNNIVYFPDPVRYRTDQLRSLFEEMGESLIGKNETDEDTVDSYYNNPDHEIRLLRNELRSEQRAKLKELLGK